MEDLLDKIGYGIDKRNEIFNLWFEVSFLRNCLNKILELNPDLHKNLDEEKLNLCRQLAKEEVIKRFPLCKIDFTQSKDEKINPN